MENSPSNNPERAGRLLLQALSNEQRGFLAAHRLLQSYRGPFPWIGIIENLCMKVPVLAESNGKIIWKSKLALLPLQTQRNLFMLLNFSFYCLPAPGIQLLATIVHEDSFFHDAWLIYLMQQFLTAIRPHLPSPWVTESLKFLCKQLYKPPREHSKLGWYTNIVSKEDNHNINLQSETLLEEEGSHVNNCDREMPSEPQSLSTPQEVNMEVGTATDEIPVLPPSIEAHAPNLRHFLYQNMMYEMLDEEFLIELNIIRELCSPAQLQALMSSVGISQIPPNCLLQFCIHLDYLIPDFSYAHANSLSTSIFLDRVLCLTTSVSRTLTTALSIFCRKYAKPACSSLIGPILDQAEPGSMYSDFLCKMISVCLQPHQLHLYLSEILHASATEVAIAVLHLLLEKKDKFCQSEFDPILSYLCHLPERFSRSVAFSRLLLSLLASKVNLIQPSYFGLLTIAVNSNQTFMKKSLQNALKKITGNV